jgi:hypothetical protein
MIVFPDPSSPEPSIMKTNRFFIPRLFPVLIAAGIANAQTDQPTLVDDGIRDYLKIVQDPDGNTNLRTAPSLESKIAGKVLSGAPVFADPEPEAGFHMVFLDKEDGTSDRYLHGSRLKPVKEWKATGPEGDSGRLRYQTFEATVKGPAFVAAEHQITTDADGMVRVDGKIPWGEDGGEPDYDLVLAVSINGKSVKLPAEATENLYNPNLSTLVLLTPGDPSEHALLMMANSDGAGGYYVVWSFEKGLYRGRAMLMP